MTSGELINVKQYRLPQTYREEVNKQFNEMMKDGIIEPGICPYNSPSLVVPKKSTDGNKRFRVVVDFRKFNEKPILIYIIYQI